MRSLAKDTSKYYNTFKKKQVKPDGKVKIREITEATGELKRVHKLILKNILTTIEYPSPPFIGGLKKKDNILNAYLHRGKPYKFCTDLKNFYPHINNKMVYIAFINRGFSADVSSILTKLTTYKGGLIQGGANSTHIAYLALWNTIQELIPICEKNQITFTVYVDDMTFSSHKDFKSVSIEIRDIIIKNGFFINHSKTFYTKGKADITGVKVGQNTLNVKNDFREKLNNTENLSELQKKGLIKYYQRVISYDKKNRK
ncbi:reverse transcriptase family protein [Elizabethkingia anophelis]|uniref:reverse transcriptase family protein n=1 Tax=Elizabethkingia anophelis TaxID=1117645 RepID=UPI0021A88A2D|nr:RNA-directed DNA polymerase [Elizabethkingia anophelis]MCT4059590.1 RNA-directed DNA polymerase [Elizabethkingia anophelis]MCT4070199.1 RNA-directed DNA polymerase [Elizabethkingia anophelis]MCT4320640.1 RNA-directed DNA polymerase [Elizabethkingia anophelis]